MKNIFSRYIISVIALISALSSFGQIGPGAGGTLSPLNKRWGSKLGFVSDTLFTNRLILNNSDSMTFVGIPGTGNILSISSTGKLFKGVSTSYFNLDTDGGSFPEPTLYNKNPSTYPIGLFGFSENTYGTYIIGESNTTNGSVISGAAYGPLFAYGLSLVGTYNHEVGQSNAGGIDIEGTGNDSAYTFDIRLNSTKGKLILAGLENESDTSASILMRNTSTNIAKWGNGSDITANVTLQTVASNGNTSNIPLGLASVYPLTDTLLVGVNGRFMINGAISLGKNNFPSSLPTAELGILRFWDGDSIYAPFLRSQDGFGNDELIKVDSGSGIVAISTTNDGAGKLSYLQLRHGDININSFSGGKFYVGTNINGLEYFGLDYDSLSFVQKKYVDNGYIPLNGTLPNHPVTGNIVFYSSGLMTGSTTGALTRIYEEDGYFNWESDNTGTGEQKSRLSLSGENLTIENIGSNNPDFKGIIGNGYYGANYTDNTYIQKKYVDSVLKITILGVDYGDILTVSTRAQVITTGIGTGLTKVDLLPTIEIGDDITVSDLADAATANNITIDAGVGYTIKAFGVPAAQTLNISLSGLSVTLRKMTATQYMVISKNQ